MTRTQKFSEKQIFELIRPKVSVRTNEINAFVTAKLRIPFRYSGKNYVTRKKNARGQQY